MNRLLTLVLLVALAACSTTQYEAERLSKEIANAKQKPVKIAIDTQNIILSSQANERLFKLHHNQAEVHEMVENIAKRYGFQLTSVSDAEYLLKVYDAKPDGGACVKGLSAFNKNATFTLSVITFGILPATNGYCIAVEAELLYKPRVYGQLMDEMNSLARFHSDAGKIDVLAGANEVDNYQRIVTAEDEARALEISLVMLFQDMIRKGAFD